MIYATYIINIKLFEKSNEEPPVAHTCSADTLTKIAGIAPTCKAKGYSDCYRCSICDKWYSDADASHEIGGRPEIDVKPNAHVAGSIWLSDATGHWHVCVLCNTVIDKVAHSMSNGVCTACGYKSQAETSDTTASTSTTTSTSTSTKPAETTATTETTVCSHICNAWTITKKATCIAKGEKTGNCIKCGESLTQIISEDPNNHEKTVVDPAVAATCGTAGKTEGSHCEACNKVITAQTEIPATGKHTWDAGEVTKAATCTAAGVKTYKCTVCKTVIKTESIPATGHKPVIDPAVAATCTSKGKTEGSHCEVCKAVITPQTDTPITLHTYDASGKCSVCGKNNAALDDLKRTDIDGDKNITLTSDLTLTLGDADLMSSGTSEVHTFAIHAGKDSDGKYGTTTLNLNGHTLVVDVSTDEKGRENYNRFFYGNLIIKGSGKIIYKGKAALFTRAKAAFGNNQYSISADDDVKFIGIKDGVEVELNKEPECKCDTYANSFYTHPDFGKHNFIMQDTCRYCGAPKTNP